MGLSPAGAQESVRFGKDFEVDLRAFELRYLGRPLKLERIPLQVLLILIEQKGQLVTRDEIAEKIWGKGVFLDTDNSINGAIRKIRQVLKDDPQQPHYVETLPGRGYRFIAPVFDGELSAPGAQPIKTEPGPTLVQSNATGNRKSVDETPIAIAAPHGRRVSSLVALAAVCVRALSRGSGGTTTTVQPRADTYAPSPCFPCKICPEIRRRISSLTA